MAVDLANRLEAALVIASVERSRIPVYGISAGSDLAARIQDAERSFVDATLQQAGAVALRGGARCELVHLRGDPAEEICAEARRRGARLVVVGAHTRSAGRPLRGGVSTRVVHDAPCPVLVVRAGSRRQDA
jgi:nucleotide-binding universal stress UspA family protein